MTKSTTSKATKELNKLLKAQKDGENVNRNRIANLKVIVGKEKN